MKVYHGKMGNMIQRLFWVFLIERIEPYQELYWTDDYFEREDYRECTVSLHAEMLANLVTNSPAPRYKVSFDLMCALKNL